MAGMSTGSAPSVRASSGHHPAVEEYLETIYELAESGIPPMRARLVERLGVSAPAVSETVRRLEREGYLTLDADRVMHLTDDGARYATSLVRRHRLAEKLLVDVLKVPWHQVHEEAGRLEHAISDNLEQHLLRLLGDPGTCPHGNPIPGSGNPVDHGPQFPMADVAVGGSAVVRRIDEELEGQFDRMLELETHHLVPGTPVTVRADDGSTLTLDVEGTRVDLARVVAEKVFCTASPA